MSQPLAIVFLIVASFVGMSSAVTTDSEKEQARICDEAMVSVHS